MIWNYWNFGKKMSASNYPPDFNGHVWTVTVVGICADAPARKLCTERSKNKKILSRQIVCAGIVIVVVVTCCWWYCYCWWCFENTSIMLLFWEQNMTVRVLLSAFSKTFAPTFRSPEKWNVNALGWPLSFSLHEGAIEDGSRELNLDRNLNDYY